MKAPRNQLWPIALLALSTWSIALCKFDENYSEFLNTGGAKPGKLQRERLENSVIKSKIEILGDVFKASVDGLKAHGVLDLVFLIDASSSVGETNFKNELKFVKKILSDVTVDFNHTRLALVTFSSKDQIVANIDEITNPNEDNNKCLLLNKEINGIRYSGGGTYTLGAFEKAQEILKNGRKSSRKVVFLITDGFSNGGDPVPVATQLKAAGVTVFTVGIINGNFKELYELSSEPGEIHSFLLDSFEEFENLARRALHVDLQSGDYLPLGSSYLCDGLCPDGDCCDSSALCTCGTTSGQYTCLCKPGFYGSGLKGSCQPCPSGSYASGSNLCLPCPDINHVSKPPAIGISSCTCKKGYRPSGTNGCEVITCPKLSAPENGYFVKRQDCGNVLNSACGVRCKVGYSLIGSSIRLCLGNATWSGQEPACQVKTCSRLAVPAHGSMTCRHLDLAQDFTADLNLPVDTVCNFTCERGRTLIGSSQRTCLPLVQWDGLRTSCRQVKCNRLSKPNFGTIEPKTCLVGKQPFGKRCEASCETGFQLVGPAEKICNGQHGSWSSQEELVCKDVLKPNLTCPGDITQESLAGKPYGIVDWEIPVVSDNSNLNVSIWTKPAIKKISNFKFKIGKTLVTYFAQDASTNRAKCSFTVQILDKEPPVIESCVDPPPFLTLEKSAQNLTWDEPNIYDNSHNVYISKSHEFGLFGLGTTQVTYTATDPSNNTNTCTLNITLQESKCEELPDPIFGHSDCQPFSDRIQCVVTCEEGYALPLEQTSTLDFENFTNFVCEHSQPIWYNGGGAFPECSISEIPLEINQTGLVEFEESPDICSNQTDLNELGNEIGRDLKSNCLGSDCLIETKTVCLDDKEEDEEVTNIIKREIGGKKRVLQKRKKVNVRFSLKGKRLLSLEGVRRIGGKSVSIVLEKPKVSCPLGSFSRKMKCVRCPAGTFHNASSNACQSCDLGSFNDVAGQSACTSCPKFFSTRKLHAKSSQDCIEQCPPGTIARKKQIKRHKLHPNAIVERITLKPYCKACPLGQFQGKYGQVVCLDCPQDFTTFSRGAKGPEECVPNTRQQCQAKGVCNGGTCEVEAFQYNCLCPEDFIGTHCEIQIDACASNPCLNNATCSSLGSTYACHCLDTFTGQNCGEITEKCQANCLNGGTCLQADDGETCLCLKGFGGDSCEIRLRHCLEGLCENGGICEEEPEGYRCLCTGGFLGKRCSYLPCDFKPCPEPAACINELNVSSTTTYSCECPEGFTGATCTDPIDHCAEKPCENSGTCENSVTTYRCLCPKPFSGRNCQTKLPTSYLLTFPRSSTTDYVALDGFQQDLTEISVCFWMKTDDSFNYGTVFSYATSSFDNAFTITDYTGLVLYINNNYVVTDVLLNDGLWHHFCSTWSSLGGNAQVFLDGNLVQNFTEIANSQNISGGGKLVLGQEQDTLGGKFSQSESFLGQMAYLDIYSRAVDLDNVREIMNSCNQNYFGDVIAWPEFAQFIQGDVKIEDSNFCKTCPDLESPYNGNVSVSGNQATYSCSLGYTLTPNETRQCLKSASWSGKDPFCKVVSCGHPGHIPNGQVLGSRFTYLDEVAYACAPNYLLQGASKRVCNEFAAWSPEEPQCLAVQCPKFAVPNGEVVVFAEDEVEVPMDTFEDEVGVGIQVEVRCLDEAELQGEGFLSCLSDGNWDFELPSCKATKPAFPCPMEHVPAAPDNAYIVEESIDEVTNGLGDTIRYKCKVGFRPKGDNFSKCIVDGYWTELKMTCQVAACGKAPTFPNMSPKNRSPDLDYIVGTTLTYECGKGYKGFGNMRLRCSSPGTWGKMFGRCFRISCGKPDVKPETVIAAKTYLFNETITVACGDERHDLFCENTGKWSGDLGDC